MQAVFDLFARFTGLCSVFSDLCSRSSGLCIGSVNLCNKNSYCTLSSSAHNRFNLRLQREGNFKSKPNRIMKQKAASLNATLKNVSAFGVKYATDFPPPSTGGQQFAIVTTAVTQLAGLGAAQVSGGDAAHAAVMSLAVGRVHLHDDLAGIAGAAHSLALLGTTGLAGKFLMPRGNGTTKLLNAARAFLADATPLKAQFLTVNLPANFLDNLSSDIGIYEAALAAKGAGKGKRGGATGGIADAAHDAAIALHVLNTVVTNTYKNDPQKLAEWVIASHVQKHTPVPQTKPAPAATLAK